MTNGIEVVSEGPARMSGVPDDVTKIDYMSDVDGTRDWALAWPDESTDMWLVCLHGHGSTGDQLYTRSDIRDARLPEFRRKRLSILTPNLRGNSWMGPSAAADLHSLLEYCRNRFGARRFVFFSGSMGGTGNLIYSILHPEDVHAAVALGAATDIASYYEWCSEGPLPVHEEIADAIRNGYGGKPDELPAVFKRHSTLDNCERLSMPVFLVHGSADGLMPVSQARALSEKLKNRSNFIYEEIPDGNHDAPLSHTHALERVLSL